MIDDDYKLEGLDTLLERVVARLFTSAKRRFPPRVERTYANAHDLGPPANADVELIFAYDYPESVHYLHHRDLDVILLDEYFKNPRCRLISGDSKEAVEPELHRDRQGFLIAKRLDGELGLRRPPLLLFTERKASVAVAHDLQRQGMLDHYQGKPSTRKAELQLSRFLRRQFDPLSMARDLGVEDIDARVRGFLVEELACWRRDAPAMLRSLALAVRDSSNGRLDFDAWSAGLIPPIPDASRRMWLDVSFWEQMLSRELGPCAAWAPWKAWYTEPSQAGTPRLYSEHEDRIRYFELLRAARGRGVPTVALFDPLVVPALSAADRDRAEREWPWFTPIDGPMPGRPKPYQIFRLRLPRRAPASTLPWLVGYWFERPVRDQWITLASHREQAVLGEASYETTLHVFAEIVRRYERSQLTVPRGMGFLCDGVLLSVDSPSAGAPRAGPRLELLLGRTHWPLAPVEMLNLHPDPRRRMPEAVPYSLPDWTRALGIWFALGEWPDPAQATEAGGSWVRFKCLAKKRRINFDIWTWWRESTPAEADGHEITRRHDEKEVTRKGCRLVIANRSRPVGHLSQGDRRLTMRDLVSRALLRVRQDCVRLERCELRVEVENGRPATILEQMSFAGPVTFAGCHVLAHDREPIDFIVRDCVFKRGMIIDGTHAGAIYIDNCVFRRDEKGSMDDTALQILQTVVDGAIKISNVWLLGGPIEMSSVVAQSVRLENVQRGRLENLRIRDEFHLRTRAPGEFQITDMTVDGCWEVRLDSRAKLEVSHTVCARVNVTMEPGAGPVRFTDGFQCREDITLADPKQAASEEATDRPGESRVLGRKEISVLTAQPIDLRPAEVHFENSLGLARSLIARRGVSISMKHVRLGLNFQLQPHADPYGRIDLEDVVIAGKMDWSGITVKGPVRLASLALFGDLVLTHSMLFGSFRLIHSQINGPFEGRMARLGGEFDIQTSCCTGGLSFDRSHFFSAIRVAEGPRADRGRRSAGDGQRREEPSDVILHELVNFREAVFYDIADFSFAAFECDVCFDDAEFHFPPNFRAIRVRGNLSMQRAWFYYRYEELCGGRTVFNDAIVRGVVDLRGAIFKAGLDFQGSILEGTVRIDGASWPVITVAAWPKIAREEEIDVSFRGASVRGLLSLSSPYVTDARDKAAAVRRSTETRAQWRQWLLPFLMERESPRTLELEKVRRDLVVDLRSSSVESLDLDFGSMRASYEALHALQSSSRRREDDASHPNELEQVADLFQRSLLRKRRLDDADEFYCMQKDAAADLTPSLLSKAEDLAGRAARRLIGSQRIRKSLALVSRGVWQHGTSWGWVAFWMGMDLCAMILVTCVVAWRQGIPLSEFLSEAFYRALKAEATVRSASQPMAPGPYWVAIGILAFLESILISLLIVSLARNTSADPRRASSREFGSREKCLCHPRLPPDLLQSIRPSRSAPAYEAAGRHPDRTRTL